MGHIPDDGPAFGQHGQGGHGGDQVRDGFHIQIDPLKGGRPGR